MEGRFTSKPLGESQAVRVEREVVGPDCAGSTNAVGLSKYVLTVPGGSPLPDALLGWARLSHVCWLGLARGLEQRVDAW